LGAAAASVLIAERSLLMEKVLSQQFAQR